MGVTATKGPLTDRLASLREEERKHSDAAYLAQPYSHDYWSATVKASRVRGQIEEVKRMIEED